MMLANLTPMPVSLETPMTIPAAAQVTAIRTAFRPPRASVLTSARQSILPRFSANMMMTIERMP